MVSRTSELAEAAPQRPSSRAAAVAAAAAPPGTPTKPRLSRLGSSPTKREDKSRDDRGPKTSAKDVAELKDYVWRQNTPPLIALRMDERGQEANNLIS